MVNGRRTDVPSMLVSPNDEIVVREESRKNEYFKTLGEMAAQRSCAVWLERDLNTYSGRMIRLPERAEIDGNLNEQLVVEYYSR